MNFRILSFFFFFPYLGFSQYTTIPDQYFEQKLIEYGYDDVIDGQVLTSSIDTVTVLHLNYRPQFGYYTNFSLITDLTGIEDFTGLENLQLYNSNIITVNLSNNTALTHLDLSRQSSSYYSLYSLDISNCPLLRSLNISNNRPVY